MSDAIQQAEPARHVRAQDVVLRRIAGEEFLIVLHAGESRMFSLNGMGLWFWQQLETPKRKSELVSAMLQGYEVDEATAAQEVERFLGDLTAKGLAATSGPA